MQHLKTCRFSVAPRVLTLLDFCYQIFIIKLPTSRQSKVSAAGKGAGGAGRARTDDDWMKSRRRLDSSGIPLHAQVSLKQVLVLASSKICPQDVRGVSNVLVIFFEGNRHPRSLVVVLIPEMSRIVLRCFSSWHLGQLTD